MDFFMRVHTSPGSSTCVLLEKVSSQVKWLHTASLAERALNHRLTQEVACFKTCIQHLNTYTCLQLQLPSSSVSLPSCASVSPCERALAVFSPQGAVGDQDPR